MNQGSPSADPSALVRRLWQYCNILRDDGLSYPDYVEQLTYLLFLKMADEQEGGSIPPEVAWGSFAGLDARAMHKHYSDTLAALADRDGMLGLIFRNARNKITDPAKLRLLVVDLIGQTRWTGLSADVKGDAYEGLLEKNARDTKSGAGQYFTPRPLIEAIVECIDPQLGEVICDPACGTGGFLLAAHQHLIRQNPRMTPAQREHLDEKALRGVELVEQVVRLAAMNLQLHGIGTNPDSELPITHGDSLREPAPARVDVVLTNPPFGVKGSLVSPEGSRGQRARDDFAVSRSDFWTASANKQLNFVQHVVTLLKPSGRAAIVVPDNVLFESGTGAVVRRELLEICYLHTVLRLPAGLFYAQGVKANVLFFDRVQRPERKSPFIWVYDLRAHNRFTLRTRPLDRDDLRDFVERYKSRSFIGRTPVGEIPSEAARWQTFRTDEILQSPTCNLDLRWDADMPTAADAGIPRLEEVSRLIADDLERALDHIARVAASDQGHRRGSDGTGSGHLGPR